MGLFSSLFGRGKENVDIPNILKIANENGGQVITHVPVSVFATYLRENGEQRSSEAGSVKGFLNVGGKRHMVGFQAADLLGLNGLKEGETLVTVFENSGIGDALDNVDPKSLGASLSAVLKEFITNEDDAFTIAIQGVLQSGMAYNEAYMAKGETRFPSDDEKPESLRVFFNKVSSDEMVKSEYLALSPDLDTRHVMSVFHSLTRDVADPEQQLIINYSIVENIIEEWNLNS